MKEDKHRRGISDSEVEQEIAELLQSENVRLARAAQRDYYRRRQYLYNLRSLEKEGKALADRGFTLDDF